MPNRKVTQDGIVRKRGAKKTTKRERENESFWKADVRDSNLVNIKTMKVQLSLRQMLTFSKEFAGGHAGLPT